MSKSWKSCLGLAAINLHGNNNKQGQEEKQSKGFVKTTEPRLISFVPGFLNVWVHLHHVCKLFTTRNIAIYCRSPKWELRLSGKPWTSTANAFRDAWSLMTLVIKMSVVTINTPVVSERCKGLGSEIPKGKQHKQQMLAINPSNHPVGCYLLMLLSCLGISWDTDGCSGLLAFKTRSMGAQI